MQRLQDLKNRKVVRLDTIVISNCLGCMNKGIDKGSIRGKYIKFSDESTVNLCLECAIEFLFDKNT